MYFKHPNKKRKNSVNYERFVRWIVKDLFGELWNKKAASVGEAAWYELWGKSVFCLLYFNIVITANACRFSYDSVMIHLWFIYDFSFHLLFAPNGTSPCPPSQGGSQKIPTHCFCKYNTSIPKRNIFHKVLLCVISVFQFSIDKETSLWM